MKYKDYYETLGVPRSATQDEIKQAYRKAARKYHPDVSKLADAEARFKEFNEANEVLKDPEKRAAYDQMGSTCASRARATPAPAAASRATSTSRSRSIRIRAFASTAPTSTSSCRSRRGRQRSAPPSTCRLPTARSS